MSAAGTLAARLAMPVIVAILGLGVAIGGLHYFDPSQHAIIDFDAFWLAGRLVWLGRAGEAYEFARFAVEQQAISDIKDYMPWTYPPPYDVLVAPLALLPRGVAYLVFILGSLIAYLAVLHRVSGRAPVAVLVVVAGPVLTNIICGQNGFLTASLIGLAAIGLLERRGWAGIPLGLMIIKPHLVVGLALYVLIDRRWNVVAVGAATVALCLAASTVLLGPSIWPAFRGGVAQATDMLAHGTYPFFRMISPYASLRTLRIAASTGFAVQIGAAFLALAGVVLARYRLAQRDAIGVAIVAGLLVSPYAYDYDLPILGIGLALLLPTLLRHGAKWEWGAGFALITVAGTTGIIQSFRPVTPYHNLPGAAPDFVNLAGLLLILALVLLARILARASPRVGAMVPAD